MFYWLLLFKKLYWSIVNILENTDRSLKRIKLTNLPCFEIFVLCPQVNAFWSISSFLCVFLPLLILHNSSSLVKKKKNLQIIQVFLLFNILLKFPIGFRGENYILTVIFKDKEDLVPTYISIFTMCHSSYHFLPKSHWNVHSLYTSCFDILEFFHLLSAVNTFTPVFHKINSYLSFKSPFRHYVSEKGSSNLL